MLFVHTLKRIGYKVVYLTSVDTSLGLPHYYRRYVDDICVLFTSLSHLETFRNLLNGQHVNMSFSINNEKQNRMLFLDA